MIGSDSDSIWESVGLFWIMQIRQFLKCIKGEKGESTIQINNADQKHHPDPENNPYSETYVEISNDLSNESISNNIYTILDLDIQKSKLILNHHMKALIYQKAPLQKEMSKKCQNWTHFQSSQDFLQEDISKYNSIASIEV